ncbi:unnamed protein product [Mytilus edulis]|uniref:Uncharacterized protein n=1 Tax=Mytilus edulis TaxID=6550 RepID=A0A8S3PWE8_MYTED|nr:unnamed protein product [Mytilus edulis]
MGHVDGKILLAMMHLAKDGPKKEDVAMEDHVVNVTPVPPCVPTSCPEGYIISNDLTASTNCYFFGGDDKQNWTNALVRKHEDIWTGLYSPTSDENFEFVDAGGALTLDTLPFGGRDQIDNEDCVEFELKTSNNWNWDDDPCDRPQQYMCEFEMFVCNNLKTSDIIAVQCADIPTDSVTNGTVTVMERNVGSTANFTCDAGLSMVGRKSIMCTISGWNGNIPQCIQCEDIPSNNLTNGAVTVAERVIGSTANFTCDAGHSIVGNDTITCTSLGWNGNIPQCRFQCKDIPTNSLTNGTVIVAERNVGSTATFTCHAGHYLANCNVLGGHLTSIETGDENAFLVDVIALMQENTEEIRLAFFWIGLTDNNDEMSYKWSSCEPLNYTEWYQGPPQQPDNRNFINQQDAHCALIHPLYFFKWGDEPCWGQKFYVCEIR